MPKAQTQLVTVSQAAMKIFGEKSHRTIKAVQRLILSGVFPGAHKIDPEFRRSPYVIPDDEVQAFIASISLYSIPLRGS
jgi:hypothetical protein